MLHPASAQPRIPHRAVHGVAARLDEPLPSSRRPPKLLVLQRASSPRALEALSAPTPLKRRQPCAPPLTSTLLALPPPCPYSPCTGMLSCCQDPCRTSPASASDLLPYLHFLGGWHSPLIWPWSLALQRPLWKYREALPKSVSVNLYAPASVPSNMFFQIFCFEHILSTKIFPERKNETLFSKQTFRYFGFEQEIFDLVFFEIVFSKTKHKIRTRFFSKNKNNFVS